MTGISMFLWQIEEYLSLPFLLSRTLRRLCHDQKLYET